MTSNPNTVGEWPADGLENVSACPVCCAASKRLVHSGLIDLFFGSAPGHWNLVACEQCGTNYLDPRPTPASLSLAYRVYYTHAAHFEKVRGLKHRLRDDYLNIRFGFRADDALWPGRWLFGLLPLTRQGIDTAIGRNLPRDAASGGKVLDVGCGDGHFLAFAKRCGWTVTGLDLDASAVAAAQGRGMDVREGDIGLLEHESESYDYISLSHVIEHVYEPLELLRHCHRLLKPGGTLWIETPNASGFGHKVFGEWWRGLEPPRHLVLFSPSCLKAKLAAAGFTEIEDRFSSFATEAIWRESGVIMDRAGARKGGWHGVLGRLVGEMMGIFSVGSREFITLVCKK